MNLKRVLREAMQGQRQSVEGAADTIWQQIPTSTKMAVGARNAVGGGNKLHFNVGRGRANKIEVIYERGQDLYTVKLWKFGRDFLKQRVVKQVNRVFAEDLGRVIYNMVNK